MSACNEKSSRMTSNGRDLMVKRMMRKSSHSGEGLMSSTSLPVSTKATQNIAASVSADGNAHSGSCSKIMLKTKDRGLCSTLEMGPDAVASTVGHPVGGSPPGSDQVNVNYGEFDLVDVVVDENKENTQVIAHRQVPINSLIDKFLCTRFGLSVENDQGDSLINLLVQSCKNRPGKAWKFFYYSNLAISDWDTFDEHEQVECRKVSLEYDVKVHTRDHNCPPSKNKTVMGPPSGIPEVLGKRGQGGQQQGRGDRCLSAETGLTAVADNPTFEQGTTIVP